MGGIWHEVTLAPPLTPEQLEKQQEDDFNRRNKQALMDVGLWFLVVGVPMVFIGFFLSRAIAHYAGTTVAHGLTPLGVSLACSGAVFRELAKWEVAISIGFFILLAYGVLSYIWKDKGKGGEFEFKHLLPWRAARDQTNP